MRYLKRNNKCYQVKLEKYGEKSTKLSFTWCMATAYIIGSNLGYEIFGVYNHSKGFVFNLDAAVNKCIDLINNEDKAEYEMRQFYNKLEKE